MKTTIKRSFAFLLALCMALTLFPFAKTQANAAALDPTNPEDAVMIYMNNKSQWNMSYISTMGQKITFIDLDLDGICELVTMQSGGSGMFTNMSFYAIDKETNKVISYGTNREIDSFPDSFEKLFFDKTNHTCFYYGQDAIRAGTGEYGTEHMKLYLLNGKIHLDVIGAKYEHRYSATEFYVSGADGTLTKSTSAGLNEKVASLSKDYINLRMEQGTIDFHYFYNQTNANQKKSLLTCYKAFICDSVLTEGLDPTKPEDAVAFYMYNSARWLGEDNPVMSDRTISFLDLDSDGINELILSHYFDGDTSTRLYHVYRIIPNTFGVWRVDRGTINVDEITKLYYDKENSMMFYYGQYTTWNGDYYPKKTQPKTNHVKFYLDNNGIVEKPYLRSDSGSNVVQYYEFDSKGQSVSISKTQYDNKLAAMDKTFVDLHLQKGEIDYHVFYGKSRTEQTEMLLNCYKAFRYDGFVFQKNTYIADLWLGINGRKDSVESKEIKTLLSNPSVSADLYRNANYKGWVMTWESLKYCFDFSSAVEETIKEADIYETLIFDMIKKTLSDRKKELTEVVTDAIDVGTKAAGYVTKPRSVINSLLALAPADQLLNVAKEWKYMPTKQSAKDFMQSLKKINAVSDKWNETKVNKVLKGIGTIADIASDVSDFYKRVTNYMLVEEIADEMGILLRTMRSCVSDQAFRTALDNVINAIGNADYAAKVCTVKLNTDLGLSVINTFIDTATDLVPGYVLLKTAYGASVAFDNIMFNTSSVIANFYNLRATKQFTEAHKAAIKILEENYKSSGSETDAGAYVYAMQTYKHVYLIDLESALNYIKAASEEGLVNKVNKFERGALNVLYDLFDLDVTIEGYYDVALRYKKSIVQSLTHQFDSLLTSWCFNEGYLRYDYPSMYPIYAADFYTSDVYTPQIISATVTNKGETKLVWSTDCIYLDDDGVARSLFGVFHLTGVEATETAGGKTTTRTTEFRLGKNSTTFFSDSTVYTFPKDYSVRSFETYDGANIYTQASTTTLETPCQPVKISPNLLKNSSLKISDDTPLIYNQIRYHVFRKEAGAIGDYKEIGVVARKQLFSGQITYFDDTTAEKGKTYNYKVVSELPFEKGEGLRSTDSNVISMCDTGIPVISNLLSVLDRRPSYAGNVTRKNAPARAKKADDAAGVSLSWAAVANASGYQIFRKSEYADDYRLLADVNGNTTAYSDTIADLYMGYTYQVIPYQSKADGAQFYDIAYAATGSVEGARPTAIPGDVSGDGEVTAEDARLALRAAVGLEDFAAGSAEFLAADASQDGEITAEDARLILRAAVGLETLEGRTPATPQPQEPTTKKTEPTTKKTEPTTKKTEPTTKKTEPTTKKTEPTTAPSAAEKGVYLSNDRSGAYLTVETAPQGNGKVALNIYANNAKNLKSLDFTLTLRDGSVLSWDPDAQGEDSIFSGTTAKSAVAGTDAFQENTFRFGLMWHDAAGKDRVLLASCLLDLKKASAANTEIVLSPANAAGGRFRLSLQSGAAGAYLGVYEDN